MPITKGAIRKQRADKRKTATNVAMKKVLRLAISEMRKKPTKANLQKAFTVLDKAAKKRVVHTNKAGRLKSRLAKLVKVK